MLDEQRASRQVSEETAQLVAISEALMDQMQASSVATSELVAASRARVAATRLLLDNPMLGRTFHDE